MALRRGGATLDLTTPWVSGRLRLVRTRVGPAALGFRLGAGPATTLPRLTWNWAVPVARGAVRGGLDLGGTRADLTGWIGSYEHGWGQLPVEDDGYDHWDSWLVHRGDATWIAHGLNRTDTLAGPRTRDSRWLGILARVGRSSVRVCRPRVARSRWDYVSGEGLTSARRLRARCGGLRARFDNPTGPPRFWPQVNGGGRGWLLQESTDQY